MLLQVARNWLLAGVHFSHVQGQTECSAVLRKELLPGQTDREFWGVAGGGRKGCLSVVFSALLVVHYNF